MTRCTSWVLSHFVLLSLSHFSVSPFFSHSISLIPVTFPLPRFAHNLCLLFWCRAFYHYSPLGIIAAGAMNSRYASTAGGTSRWWMHNCIDVAVLFCVCVCVCVCVWCPYHTSVDLSIVAVLTPPTPLICSSTSPAHLSSCNQWGGLQPEGSALSSPLDFKKSHFFFLPFPFLSSASESTLLLTSGLLLCVWQPLCHV